MDVQRTFAEVVFWGDGRIRHHGRVDMSRSGLEGFGRSLRMDDEIVIEATGRVASLASGVTQSPVPRSDIDTSVGVLLSIRTR
jgi:hypothetical protein